MRWSEMKNHVSRTYGGSMGAKCVLDRIKQDFLEQKIMKVLKAKAKGQHLSQKAKFKKISRDFPGGPVVKTWSFQCFLDLIPGRGTKILTYHTPKK
uniref:Large ribosomal subunit protein eL34 n=1 Tax=Capra hircus TaxID=9925 RepID=A0A8C2NAY5_CAPHI